MSDTDKEAEKDSSEGVGSSAEDKKDEAEGASSSADEETSTKSDIDESASPKEDDEDEDDSSHSDSEDSSDEDDEDEDEDEVAPEHGGREAAGGGATKSSSASLLIGVLALAAGFGIGWYGHDFQMKKAEQKADASVEGKGEGARGPCKDWETAICAEMKDTSFACNQAKMASGLLSGSACVQAQAGLTSTFEAIRAERAKCDELQTKLCQELGADSKACELVKSQTPSFPPDRCEQMMASYDQVLAQLKMMEQRGAIPGAGRPPGHPGAGGPPPSVSRPPSAPPDGATPTPPATPPASSTP